jgi:hypothetical protein
VELTEGDGAGKACAFQKSLCWSTPQKTPQKIDKKMVQEKPVNLKQAFKQT